MDGVGMNTPFYEIKVYFPPDFLNKTKNELFIQKIMSMVFPGTTWIPGNPDKFEPDYFCDGIPFEFTIASDHKEKNYKKKFSKEKYNFIEQVRHHIYSTENVDEDFFRYIRERIADKAMKKYSVHNVHLCVLCLLDLTDWVLDKYGSTHGLADWPRQEFFEEIRTTYITAGIFSNIFILFPDMFAKWWIWDVSTDRKSSIQFDDSVLKSGEYPYCILKAQDE